MATLDTTPEVVDITTYAGDTFTLKVTAPGSLTDGKTWSAVVKASRDSDVVDATFDIIPPDTSGGPAYLTLPSAVTASLVSGAAVRTIRGTAGVRMVQQYSGEWDCQISNAGSDPVRTLAQGTILITLDVTRA